MNKQYKNYKMCSEVGDEFNTLRSKCKCTVDELIDAMVHLIDAKTIREYIYKKGDMED